MYSESQMSMTSDASELETSSRRKVSRRAAFLVPSDRLGGAERVVKTLATCAANSGLYDHVDVFVLCWSRTDSFSSLLSSTAVRLHYTEAKSELGGVVKMARFLMKHRFSLVVSSSTHINAFVSICRRLGLLRADRVVARESTVIFDRSFGWGGVIFRALYRLYGGQDMIVCQTERMRESLDRNTKNRFHDKLVTLPNPIDFDRIRAPDLNTRENVFDGLGCLRIVWCGRLSSVKSPDLAIRTLAKIRESGVNEARLVMIGDGPARASLESLASDLGISEYVTFMGHVLNPCPTMAVCQLGLLTSKTEGFPNVVLEMLGSGVRKIVTTNCAGGLDEIPGVVVVDSAEPSDLAYMLTSKHEPPSEITVEQFLRKRSPEIFFARVAGNI